MNNRKSWNFKIITVVAISLMLHSNVAVYAQENISKRAKQRKVIPLDELKIDLERPARDEAMQPARVLDVFGVKRGEIVADIGAGTGYFTFRLANKVGPEGKIYAVEIEDELLDYINKKMERNNVANIIPMKSSEPSPNLPPASCDKMMVAGSYYYFPDPVLFMSNARRALKPGGLVAIVDLDRDTYKEIKYKKFVLADKLASVNEVVGVMNRAGYTLRESHDFLPGRFFLVFNATEDASQTVPLK
ncbi:MAG: class I SAM-dependent methyltransferase [Candidatus Riflebacteria bacterium]|nr:class I SAM-dependent methyltransferase [Candidatus Riflebacteria bacterium]